jgi:general secretion pathway protein C
MILDELRKRRFWAVILPLTAIAPFLDAERAMRFVADALLPDERQLATREPPTGAAATLPSPPPETAPPPHEGAGPLVSSDIKNGVRRVAATEYDVDRGVVDILEHRADLVGSVPVYPEQENGTIVGIRVFGVGPDTRLAALGIESGDRVEKIDDIDMTSPEKALEAYARIRTANRLTLSVNRGGRTMHLDYNIK